MGRRLKLFDREIEDVYIRENFQRIGDFFRDFAMLKGEFKLFRIIIANTTGSPITYTGYKRVHGLGFTPMDVLQTRLVGGSVTWNYAVCTSDEINADITVNANSTLELHAFVGRYEEGDLNG